MFDFGKILNVLNDFKINVEKQNKQKDLELLVRTVLVVAHNHDQYVLSGKGEQRTLKENINIAKSIIQNCKGEIA